MPLYLPVNMKGNVAIAICQRCQRKMQYDELYQDPNNMNWYCREDVDELDPYRKPQRRTEDISLQHPRPDVPLAPGDE